MQPTGERWRLGHRPALDGLRGIAVLIVVTGHMWPRIPAALTFDGVSVFFALSGFLITTLLLERRDRSGRFDLVDFYWRRALRLFPALAALLLVLGLVDAMFRPGLASPGSITAAALYYGNWLEATGTVLSSGLTHTWSLSVEEQFYVVWPLVLLIAARFGRRAMIGTATALLVASLTWTTTMLAQGVDQGRAYFGSDTRADGLLIGCLLALYMSGKLEGRARPVAAAWIGFAGLLATSYSMVMFPGHWVRLVTIPAATALAAAGMIWCSAQGPGVRWLSPAWLRWLGQRSYGLYLWHVPVLVVGKGAPWWVLLLVMLLITEASWRLVEVPVQRWGRRRLRLAAVVKQRRRSSVPLGRPADGDAACS